MSNPASYANGEGSSVDPPSFTNAAGDQEEMTPAKLKKQKADQKKLEKMQKFQAKQAKMNAAKSEEV